MTTATATTIPFQGSRIGSYRRGERTLNPPVGVSRDRDAAPNYLARRVLAGIVTVLAIATLAVAISGVLASFGGGPASASEVSPANTSIVARTHVAVSGDTMWSIASAYSGEIDHGRYVDALIRANGGVAITVGQAVQLP